MLLIIGPQMGMVRIAKRRNAERANSWNAVQAGILMLNAQNAEYQTPGMSNAQSMECLEC